MVSGMQENKIQILSTRPLTDALVEEIETAGFEIDVLSFIETEPIRTFEVQQEIEQVLLQSATVVFTSMNAIEAVADELHGQQPGWNIYCINNATRQRAVKYFGEEKIAGTAGSAAELAELIAQNDPGEVIFFCGNQRRDELPDILRNNDIAVNEIVVYQTIVVLRKIKKTYNGILFFSPSAVQSFFNNNKVPGTTILFAIGNTTANEIRKFTNNTIITSEEPGKENLVMKMMEFFSS